MSELAAAVVSEGGVTVEKSFEPDEFPVPAIAFVLASERDERVTVRLTDELPAEVAADDVGFHPEFGEEHWSVEEGTLVFERDLPAGESVTTVYALRDQDLDSAAEFLEDPTLEVAAAAASVLGDDGGDPVRDVIAGDADTVPGLEEEAQPVDIDADGDDEEIEPIELSDPSGEDDRTADEAAANAPSGASPTGAGAPPDAVDGAPAASGVAAALARELRDGTVDPAVENALRAALGAGGPSGSETAQLATVREDVTKLRAYVNALEAFLDENGDAQTLLRDLRGELGALESRVGGLDDRVETVDDQVGSVDDRVTTVDDRVGSVSDDVEELAVHANETDDRFGDVEDEVEAVADHAETVERELDAVREEVDDLYERTDESATRLEALDESTDDLAHGLAHTERSVESVREDLASVRDDLDAVRDEAADAEAVADVADRLEATTDELVATVDRVEAAEDRVADVEATLDDAGAVADRLDELEDDLARLDALSARLDDAESSLDRLDEQAERLDEAESRLADFDEFQARMAGVFGGDAPDE